MPVSILTARDPFRGPRSTTATATDVNSTSRRRRCSDSGNEKTRVPQMRILHAMMPTYPEDPPIEWPLMSRPVLAARAGYTAISGSVTRALNGIRSSNRTSGTPHPGLIDQGLVEVVEFDVDGRIESNYRITAAGIRAYQQYIADVGKLPPHRDISLCINNKYKTKAE